MLCHLLFGVSLLGDTNAFRSCYSEAQVSVYHFCNLTVIPHVPKDTGKLLLSFNYIRRVTTASFPLLENLWLLEIGGQLVYPLTIGKGAFRNLPNLLLLDLGHNIILQLDLDALMGLPRLKILRLFGNNLGDSILEERYFQGLTSLEEVELSSNRITRLRPHPLFHNLTLLTSLNLKHNHVSNLCESDLSSFQGKHFTFFSLRSNRLREMDERTWASCSNPFQNITFSSLDIGDNGWSTEKVQYFSATIQGTQIISLNLAVHIMGSGFGYENLKNPDNYTFAGLARSHLHLLDVTGGFIFSLNPFVFQSLDSLERLNLFGNKINQIQREAFFGLGNLIKLNLSSNLLGELYDYSFEGLQSLVHLDLKQNHIGMIGRNAFSSLKNLKEIDLRDNAIKNLPSFPNLTAVFLGDNKLMSIGGTKIAAATYLEMERNWLSDLGELYVLFQVPDVQFIFLKQNRFTDCVTNGSNVENSQLIYLDLGYNMLQLVWEWDLCLDVFGALSKLQVLHLNNNYLRFLPQEVFKGLTSLNRLNLASNFLSHLSPGLFPQSLTNLNLSWNQLFSPQPEVFMTLSILDITHNQYVCDCSLKPLLVWLNQTNITLAGSQYNLSCAYPPALERVPLSSLNYEDCDEDELQLRFSVFLFTSITILVLMVTVIIFTRCRGVCFVCYKTITQKIMSSHPSAEDGGEYKYDAYLCYSRSDFEWVQNSLLKHLDSQYLEKNRFTLCIEERDFLPGEEHINNIREAIWNSRKTICVVTKRFLQDGWCVEAFNFAQSRYFSDLKDVLIMVVVGSVPQYQLMKHRPIRNFLQRSRYLCWPEDYQDVDWFLNNLSGQILKEKKVQKKGSNIELQTVATISH
ncbi:TLR5 protein, partial [Turnix velox]|nr:TLR5 protein [Turnix velox]